MPLKLYIYVFFTLWSIVIGASVVCTFFALKRTQWLWMVPAVALAALASLMGMFSVAPVQLLFIAQALIAVLMLLWKLSGRLFRRG
jgi:hypothetical protein